MTVIDNMFTGRKKNIAQWIGHPDFSLIIHDVVEPIMMEVGWDLSSMDIAYIFIHCTYINNIQQINIINTNTALMSLTMNVIIQRFSAKCLVPFLYGLLIYLYMNFLAL